MTDRLTIEIMVSHCMGGEGNDVFAGHVMVAPRDLPIEEAMRKVRIGYARVIPNAAGSEAQDARETKDKPPPGPAAIEHKDPVPETRDPIYHDKTKRISRPPAGRR